MAKRPHLELRKKDRQILLDLLDTHFPDVEAWAYGSRVNGQSHESSDLDLVLRNRNQQAIDPFRLSEFRDALQESAIPILVDVKDWATLPESFQNEIKNAFIVLSSGRGVDQ